MQWDITLDVCALVALVVFCTYTFSMKRFKTRLSKMYDVFCVVIFISILLDILGVVTVSYSRYFSPAVIYIVNMLYLLVINSMGVMFYYYLLLLTDSNGNSVVCKILRVLPYLCAAALILTTPITGWVIYIDASGTYIHGSQMLTLHVLSGIYIILCIITLLRYRKNISTHRMVAIFLYMALLLAAIGLQAVFPNLLLLGFACTLGVITLYLGQYNPNETIDDKTDLFNQNSFSSSIASYIKEGERFSIIVFETDKFQTLEEQYGDQTAQAALKKIADFLLEIFSEQTLYKLDGYRFAIIASDNSRTVNEVARRRYSYASDIFSGTGRMNESEDEQIILQAIMERFDHPWHIGEDDIRMTVCICYMTYPEDVKRSDEINDMIDSSLKYAQSIGPGTILYAAEYTKTRERYIDELQQKQIDLEEMTKRAEEARINAENADASKTKFLANMSHEIRTPMNAIMGMTELVLRDNISDQVRKNMSNIQSAGNTLLTIINDILDFSKVEAGKMEVVSAPYETASLLNNVLSVGASRLVGKNLNFIVDADPTIPSGFLGDEMRLRQIIITLLGNAIKYTKRGSVTLKLYWTLRGNSSEDDDESTADLTVEIIDTGSGIREEDLAKLFHSFTRIDEQKNRLIEGTGLGLSICKRLADLMSGTISVESEYGAGSKFTLRIPQKIINIRPFVFVEEAEGMNTLLYAEDSAIQEDLSRILAQLGISCTMVDSEKNFNTVLTAQSFTHIFVEYSLYERIKDQIKSQKMKLILALKSNQLVNGNSKALVVQSPFYCLNVAEVLNDLYTNFNHTGHQVNTYIAPEAKILAVDDSAVNLQIITGLLQPHKMQVDTVESGKECLELLKKKRYHLILMDHMMPDMDGIETLNAIRAMEDENCRTVPVVVVSAKAISGVRKMFEEVGFQDYISKPISIERLEDVVLRYIPLELIKDDVEEEQEKGEIVSMFIPGVDIQQGIENCGGSFQNYITLLSVVLQDGRKKLDAMEKYRENEEFDQYIIEVHALKSVAASIGADQMSVMAKQLEMACREQRYYEVKDGHRAFCDAYSDMLDHIEDALEEKKKIKKEEKPGTRQQLSEQFFHDRVLALLALLHDYEEDAAGRLLSEVLEYELSEEQTALLDEISRKLELFDYDEAEKLIKGWLSDHQT